jgi:hypothetical protein
VHSYRDLPCESERGRGTPVEGLRCRYRLGRDGRHRWCQCGVVKPQTPDLSFSMRLKKLEVMITAINFSKTL